MLNEQHRYVVVLDQALDLLAHIDVYIIQRFVPEIEVRVLAQGQGDHDEFLLPQ